MGKMIFQWTAKDGGEKWKTCMPRENLSPEFNCGADGLRISADGGKNFGWYGATVKISPSTNYRFQTRFFAGGMANLNVHIMNLLYWTDSKNPNRTGPHDAILSYVKNGDGSYTGSQIITSAPFVDTVEIQLGARYIDGDKITWVETSLEEVEKPLRKPVRIAAARWNPMNLPDRDSLIKELTCLIDQAGGQGADLFLLPEFTNVWSYDGNDIPADRIPDGLIPALLSKKSKEYGMYICAGISEEEDGYVYNAGAIFGRDGSYVGKYRKNHLYWPEEIFTGTLPGDGYPVFDLDFGRVGIMICYDSWFPETARLLTLKGAELILFPNAGYEEKIMPARCIDNNNYMAISSLGHVSGIMNTLGDFEAVVKNGIAIADIQLDDRRCCHPNAGGSMNAGGAGQRTRLNSPSDLVYREIAEEIKKYDDRPWRYTW